MNFDHTYIAIRRRSVLEIMDLSLHVIREYLAPLSILWLVGVLPFAIINWYLIGWLGEDYFDGSSLMLYFYLMLLLIMIQAQVATLPITIFLGKSMFDESPGIMETLWAALKCNPYMYWVHGILRLIIPTMLLTLVINPSTGDDGIAAAAVWLTIFVLLGMIIRVSRPFASEILCLEKTPALRKKEGQITYAIRSLSLHRAASGEVFGRAFVLFFLVIPLTFTILGALLSIDALLNLSTDYETLPVVYYGPIAAWIAAGIMAVVRFLNYIDIRIRQEGWEVELRLRAEAMRMQQAGGTAS